MPKNPNADYETQLAKFSGLVRDGEAHTVDLLDASRLIRRNENKKSDTTLKNYGYYLKRVSKDTDVPLREIEIESLKDTIALYRSGNHPEVKDDGINVKPYQSALRVFFRFVGRTEDVDNIELDSHTSQELTPDDLLYREDVDAMLEACGMNVRDKALIALALATGQRADAIRTLKVGDVTQGKRSTEVTLNHEDGYTKGANGSKPLLWARHYVDPWLSVHPYKDNPDAGLFPATGGGHDGPEPMSPTNVRHIVRKRARQAGIEKRVYPHLFRHSAITRMILEGLNEPQIKRIVGWDEDSSQFGTYSHLADEISNDSVRRQLGLPTENNEDPAYQLGRPTFMKCMQCGDELPDGSDTCGNCGEVLTHKAHIDQQEAEQEADEAFEDVLEQALEDDEKKDLLIETLKDELT